MHILMCFEHSDSIIQIFLSVNLLKHFKVNYIVQFASVPVIILYSLEVYAVCKYYMIDVFI